MTFKIGDEVIMTADSGKGLVLTWCGTSYYKQLTITNGDYNGRIIEIKENSILVDYIWGCFSNVLYFNLDGSCSTHPGMSIRLADPAKEQPTPSQWIEGKAPEVDDRKTAIWIWRQGWITPIYYSSIGEIGREYTHWQYVQLPPPPPVKEVEAFGYLVAVDKIITNSSAGASADDVLNDIVSANNFYSKPATAEVLNKYLKIINDNNTVINWSDTAGNLTLDKFINWISDEYTIFFTPAALEELEKNNEQRR